MRMKNLTLENISRVCKGKLFGKNIPNTEAACVVIDSRKIEPGGIFIATKGERADGHDFIPKVAEAGALGIICEKMLYECRVPFILVENSFQALKDIAEFYREQLTLPVVGITGSVGKTSTKEMIAGVLSRQFKVWKTEGNFNNEIGLPLTVLGIRKEHQAAVLEMGISDFGEMHRLSKIAKPDICVMTNIGQCHLENLGSREGILKAKSEIFDFMNPKGRVIVNGDDDLLCGLKKRGAGKVIHFGLQPGNDVFASDVMSRGLLGTQAVIHMDLEVFPVEIPLPGAHMVYNALAAAAVGKYLGLNREQIREGIAEVKAVGGRSNVLALQEYTVIDDCYNANPVSMKAAIDLLAMALGRKVAVLGDMFELGGKEEEMHAQVGAYAADKGIDMIICVGRLSRFMYEEAAKTGSRSRAFYFETREEMQSKLKHMLQPGDNVLVKASHGMQFEKVVEYLRQ